MNAFRPKLWSGLGAAALLLAACTGESGEAGAAAEGGEAGASPPAAGAPVGEGGEGGAEGGGPATGEAGANAAYEAVPEESRRALRLAHLKGFFLAAQQVRQAQGAEAASALAGQGMLEVFDPAAANFRAAGLDEAVLRKAADTGDAASLNAAVGALTHAQSRAGGDPAAVTRAMASIAAGLYRNVLTEGAIDAVEYQHAYGAALSAREVAAGSGDLASAKTELDRLVRLWPSPVAPEDPTKVIPPGQVQAQVSRVELALSGV